MIRLAPRIRRVRGDVGHDLRDGRRLRDVQRHEARSRQEGEDAVNEGGNILRVLRVAVVDAAGGPGDEVGVEDHSATGCEARGAVNVERDGRGVRIGAVAGGADRTLHASDGAVRVLDRVPEDADFGGEGVGARATVEVQGRVAGRGAGVAVGICLDRRAGELDEGIRIVEANRRA